MNIDKDKIIKMLSNNEVEKLNVILKQYAEHKKIDYDADNFYITYLFFKNEFDICIIDYYFDKMN